MVRIFLFIPKIGVKHMKTIKVKDIVKNNKCTDIKDAKKLYSLMSESINKTQTIMVSFEDIDRLIMSFLTASFGRLYKDFPHEKVDMFVKIGDCNPFNCNNKISRSIDTFRMPKCYHEKQTSIINRFIFL